MEDEDGKERSTAAFWTEEAEVKERDQTAFRLNSGTCLSAGRCCRASSSSSSQQEVHDMRVQLLWRICHLRELRFQASLYCERVSGVQ